MSLSKTVLSGAAAIAAAASLSAAGPAFAQTAPEGVKNVLLIHGAFADGSGWRGVYDNLTARGYRVTVVQTPMTSLEADVAATDRALARQDGPAILVGHSYGGIVITEAGDDPKVAGLVYVAAFAPNVGESALDQYSIKPPPPDFHPDPAADGFVFLGADTFKAGFAGDLSDADANWLRDSQMPIFGGALGAKVTQTAWSTKPSWYVVATQDGAIDPELERIMARRISATTTEIDGSHVVFISQPDAVANVIAAAAVGSARATAN